MDLTRLNNESIEENNSNLRETADAGEFTVESETPVFEAEKEPAHEAGASEKDDSYSKIISKINSDDSGLSYDSVPEDAREASMRTDAESQVKHLVDIASVKGVFHAVKVAKHLEDNYVLDAFHDRLLSDDLHEALVEKGLIERI